MEERKPPPTVPVLLAALLGVFALPRGTSSDNSASKATPAKTAAETLIARSSAEPQRNPPAAKNPDLAVLAPLLELTDNGSRGRLDDVPQAFRFDNSGRKAVVHEIVSAVQERKGQVRTMIALIPDPARTSATQDYDSRIDGLACGRGCRVRACPLPVSLGRDQEVRDGIAR
jgi:hypothetical protein